MKMKAISFVRIAIGIAFYLIIVSVFEVAKPNALYGLAVSVGILILFEKVLEIKK